jgi:alginate O-acetyltransferase complex protein AlgF
MYRRSKLKYLSVLLLGISAPLIWAQQTTLYDPQPPANSAYVRVLAGGGQEIDILLDQKPKATKVSAGSPSTYMIVPAGKHEMTVKAGAQTLTIPLQVEASRSMTILLAQVNKDAKPTIIEDKINGNRLKAMISAYNLGTSQAVDVWTADGSTQVFNNLSTNGTAALPVNPVALDYMVTASGQKTALAQSKFTMSPGGAYSIVISSDKNGKVSTQAFTNSTERYSAQ